MLPTCWSIVLGALLGNIAITAARAPYAHVYTAHGLGGLIFEVYHPVGWSKFCLVILTFSVLGNNIAINYSSGLSLQLLGHYFHAVPRFIWSFLFAIVVAGECHHPRTGRRKPADLSQYSPSPGGKACRTSSATSSPSWATGPSPSPSSSSSKTSSSGAARATTSPFGTSRTSCRGALRLSCPCCRGIWLEG